MRKSRSWLLISLLLFLVIMMTLAEPIGKWLGLLLSQLFAFVCVECAGPGVR